MRGVIFHKYSSQRLGIGNAEDCVKKRFRLGETYQKIFLAMQSQQDDHILISVLDS